MRQVIFPRFFIAYLLSTYGIAIGGMVNALILNATGKVLAPVEYWLVTVFILFAPILIPIFLVIDIIVFAMINWGGATTAWGDYPWTNLRQKLMLYGFAGLGWLLLTAYLKFRLWQRDDDTEPRNGPPPPLPVAN